MKDLQNILIESLLDDEDTLTKPIEDFYLKPFQSIFNCGPKIKSQGDWEHYVKLFESSINAECESSFEHGGDYVYTAERHKKQWVLSIKNEGPDNRKIIVLYEYKGPYLLSTVAIVSFRRSPEKIRLRVGANAMKQLNIKGQKGMSYVLSKKQMKMVEDMLDNWVRGDFQDWLKK
jgi:hypothetical protein